MERVLIALLIILTVVSVSLLYWRERVFRSKILSQETDSRRKLYELAILKKLGEGIGDALDVENIVQIVTGSLHQFIDYTTVSYMLFAEKGFVFTIDLKDSVSKKFIVAIRTQMKKSLEALLDTEIKDKDIDERVTGAIPLAGASDNVRSYFNIPLVIDEKVVGLLTVAHTKPGLYKEEDMTILYKIVSQASQAVTKLEHVVRTEQGKLSAMVESLEDGVVMTDKEYRVLVVNPAAKRYAGLEHDPSIDILDFVESLDGRFDIKGKLEESILLDKVVTVHNVSMGGRFFKIVVAPVKGVSEIVKGKILGGVVVFHDMTKEKEDEKLREDFTSMMIHELRSPLDGIKKIGEMMHDDSIRTEKKTYDEYVKMIYNSSSQMLELVNDLLDVARIESNALELFTTTSSIKAIIEERLRFFKMAVKDKDLTLTARVADDVPRELIFDPVRVEQVLNNLLSNTLKYTDRGDVVTINAFVHKTGEKVGLEAGNNGVLWFVGAQDDDKFKNVSDCVVVAVTDSGIGIQETDVKNLFGVVDKDEMLAKNRKKNLGLGLIIVKGIIERQGGIVGVASKVGEGSTFYFTINV